MSIQELSSRNSYTDGSGSVVGHTDVYSKKLYANSISSTYSLLPVNRYQIFIDANQPTVPTSIFPCGLAYLDPGTQVGLNLPTGAQLDTLLGTTGTPGPMVWFDVVNANPNDNLTLFFTWAPGQTINIGIPKAQAANRSTYTRFWFVKPESDWIILSA